MLQDPVNKKQIQKSLLLELHFAPRCDSNIGQLELHFAPPGGSNIGQL